MAVAAGFPLARALRPVQALLQLLLHLLVFRQLDVAAGPHRRPVRPAAGAPAHEAAFDLAHRRAVVNPLYILLQRHFRIMKPIFTASLKK